MRRRHRDAGAALIAAFASAPARRHAPQPGDTLRAIERRGWRRARVRDGSPSGARRWAFDSGSTRSATALPRAAGFTLRHRSECSGIQTISSKSEKTHLKARDCRQLVGIETERLGAAGDKPPLCNAKSALSRETMFCMPILDSPRLPVRAFAMACGSMWCRNAAPNDLLQRGDPSSLHVWRRVCDSVRRP